jgi:hypothetical protein
MNVDPALAAPLSAGNRVAPEGILTINAASEVIMTTGQGQASTFDHVGPRHMVSNRGWHTVWRLLGSLLCLTVGIGYLMGPPC